MNRTKDFLETVYFKNIYVNCAVGINKLQTPTHIWRFVACLSNGKCVVERV